MNLSFLNLTANKIATNNFKFGELRKSEFYVVKKMSINLDIVFVAARRAETALAAERNEFKISAMRTGIHGAAVRRVTTMNHLVDIFQ